ncbi:unnamed protein product [Boreogadus saida]
MSPGPICSGRGIPRYSHSGNGPSPIGEVRQVKLCLRGGRIQARPVAQSNANTPRHDSSTSDFMKLQTMGGPPEELWNGLLDDTRRSSSRTNSTRVVAFMVPV